ncbi:MAG: helix-turn-helix domain-containing GNAT family N-acetyltransferase [Holophagales bacterium]|nr:helix-turn-helix domain-containing GNAT family N-acetyltransferase [Holophagales bacterium]
MAEAATARAEDADPELRAQISRIRRFNRFFTQKIGVLDMLDAELPLSAARVVFEIENRGEAAAVDLSRMLDLDPGYLSRLVRELVRRGLVERHPSPDDARRRHLVLTAEGRSFHRQLTEKANGEVAALLAPLDVEERRELTAALEKVERVLGSRERPKARIREHGPGDLGWMLQRHGELYRRHYEFDHRFEALVARIVLLFAEESDPARDRLWIAEADGERLGSIMHVHEEGDISRLRAFLVEPRARGMGVGSDLLETCLDFSRRKGYRRMVLSTVSALDAARRLYERAGFVLTHEHDHADWSVPVTEQVWELDLRAGA